MKKAVEAPEFENIFDLLVLFGSKESEGLVYGQNELEKEPKV